MVSQNINEAINHPRLMFLVSSLTIGGSERKTVRIANSLASHGWTITVAYLNGPHTLQNEISDKVNTICINRRGKFDISVIVKLIRYIKQNNVNVICLVNLYPLLYGFLSNIFLLKHSIKLIATTNSTEFIIIKDKLKMFLYAPMLRRVDNIIFGCDYQRQLWIKKYCLTKSSCTYIYNGVNTDYFHRLPDNNDRRFIREQIGIPEDAIVIGSIGRFRKEKQYQFLIRACAAARQRKGLELHCLLVGGGDEESFLRELILELGCESFIHLLGAEDDVRPFLAAMDIFALSSVTETFSNAALEAMAMGLPVLLPAIGGCPEMVEPGKNGFIYRPNDVDDFISHLLTLASDRTLLNEMASSARQYAIENFRYESMINAYSKIFNKQIS